MAYVYQEMIQRYYAHMIKHITLFIRNHLVDDIRDWWRWWSVRLLGLALALQAISISSPDALMMFWQMLPAGLRAALPDWLDDLITAGLMLAALIARHVKQPAPVRGHDIDDEAGA